MQLPALLQTSTVQALASLQAALLLHTGAVQAG
jgi:hypothetical protein